MPDLRFLISRRWIGFAVFVVAMAAVCLQLGLWQFHKLDDREARNDRIVEHLGADPVPLEDVVPVGTTIAEPDEWTVVTVTGVYDVDHEVTVKYISRNSRPGVDVVTPLVLADGSALLVNRGFLETPRTNALPDVPAPPSGEVEVTGWVRVNSGATGDAVKVHDQQIRAISSDGFAGHVPYDLRDGYLNLQEQSPPVEGLEAEPVPDLSQGTHFFYGLQWWFFAALALVGFVWFARAEKIERAEQAAKAAKATTATQASETSSA